MAGRKSRVSTQPHGRCVAGRPCVEHAADKSVPSCKTRDRRDKNDWHWIAPFYSNVSSSRGAPMGRGVDDPEDFDLSKPLHIAQVPMVDGDYDPGGAYWGSGLIYCVWDETEDEDGYEHRLFKRGDIGDAKELFPPGTKFVEHEVITCPACQSEAVHTNDRSSGDMECYDYLPKDEGEEGEDEDDYYGEGRKRHDDKYCDYKWNVLATKRGSRVRKARPSKP